MARFLRRHEGSAEVQAAMIAKLEQRWHFRWRDMDTATLAEQAARAGGAPLLVVHADDDVQVPVLESEGLAADWPGAVRLLAPDGCGHLHILRDATVVAAIVDFVTHH